jgi:PKD repeat protein
MKITQDPLTIDFSHVPTVAWVGENVLLNATDGYDSYTWDFGDGSTASSSPTVDHVFERVGNLTVTLGVTVGGFSNSTSGTMMVTFITDLDKDGRVGMLDVTTVARAYGSRHGDLNWNPLADVDRNGVVNIVDMSMVERDYGKTI